MKRKLLLLSASLLAAASMSAQWVRPVPQPKADYAVGDTAYLYNKDAGAFFMGANDYETRASVVSGQGAKVTIQNSDGGDGTVYLISYVAKFKEYRCSFWGGDANGAGIWVDNNTHANRYWFMEKVGDYYRFYNAAADGKAWLGTVASQKDTKLYLCDESYFPLDNADTEENESDATDVFGVDWYFVDSLEYNALVPKLEIYGAADVLGRRIESVETEYAGIDLSAAKAVYNNLNSTKEELTAALAIIDEAILEYAKSHASMENPTDMSKLVADGNTTFESNSNGWQTTTGAQNSTIPDNENAMTKASAGTGFTGRFWENWNGSAFTGQMYTVVKNLPEGIYEVEISAYADTDPSGSYVFANKDSVALTSNDPNTYKVITRIGANDSITLGVKQVIARANWIGMDNVYLRYFGVADDAYQAWIKQYLDAPIETEGVKAQKAAIDAYTAAFNAAKTATTKDEIIKAKAELDATAAALAASVSAYSTYIANAEAKIEIMSTTELVGDPVDLLATYLTMEMEPDEDYANGTYEYIINNCLLSAEEILAENERLNEMYDATKDCLAPGADITSYITNPNFADKDGKGWENPDGVTMTGGLAEYPCAEAYQKTFDVYQTVKGLPVGIYRVSLNAFYRPGANGSYDGSEDVPAVVYFNEFEAKVQHIMKDPSAEQAYAPGDWQADYETSEGWVPNSMNGASTAFLAGRYLQNVYGLVTDGDMRLGIKSTRPAGASSDWCLWTNFKLTFMGKDEAALAEVGASLKEQADEITANYEYNSTEALANIEKAKAAFDDAADGDEMFDAIIALNKAMNDVKAGGEGYANLTTALDNLEATLNEYTESPYASDAAGLYTDVLNQLNAGSIAVADIEAKIQEVKDMTIKVKIPAYEDASDDNTVDFTGLIENPSFDDGTVNGWTITAKAQNLGYQSNKVYTNEETGASLNQFIEGWIAQPKTVEDGDIAQTLKFLPNGAYALEADVMAVFQGDANTPVTGLYLFAQEGETVSRIAVSSKNEIPEHFTLYFNKTDEGANVTVGLRAEGTTANWMAADNFKLTYFGKESTVNIEDVNSAATEVVISTSYYTIGGALVAAPVKGVNIVKQTLSDGTVKVSKILVK